MQAKVAPASLSSTSPQGMEENIPMQDLTRANASNKSSAIYVPKLTSLTKL